MPYSGNLVSMQQAPDSRKLPPPSPRHATNEVDPNPGHAEHVLPSGTGSEYQGTDFERVVMSGGGMPLDNPAPWAITPPGGPSESPYHITYPRGNPHDSQAVLSARGSQIQTCSPAGGTLRDRAHDGIPDRGWLRRTFSPKPMFGESQHIDELYLEGLPSSVETASGNGGAKYVRGINGLPTNNPDRVGYTNGFRPGIERVRVWDNANRSIPYRQYGLQTLGPREVYVPNPARRMVGTMVTQPALPRDASNPDDTIMANTNYASSPSSVIGGF